MSKKKNIIHLFLSKINWKYVAIGIAVIIVAIVAGLSIKWLAGIVGAGLAALGLGKRRGVNSIPRGRDEALGEEDEFGFIQEDQIITDDPTEFLDDLPSGLDEDEIDVVITSDPEVEITMTSSEKDDKRIDKIKTTRDTLAEYLKKKGAID